MNPFRRLADWFRGAESRSTLTHAVLGLTDPFVAGVAVTPESALGVSAVFCADRVLSEGVGTLPKIVYRDADGTKERAKQHPLYKVLRRRPNPEQTAAVFWNLFQHRVNLWGYGACEIVRDGAGQVRELWNLDPQTTRIDRVAGRLVFDVPAQGGGRVTLPRDDVYLVPGPSPDGSVGYRILHYARMTFGMAIAAQRFGSAVFANSPRPGAVLKTKGRLSPEAYANLRSSWQALYSGPDQAGKPAVLEEDLDYVPIPFVNNEQLQLEELSQFLVVEVCRFFNVSPVKVHDLGRATWSNLEQLDTDFVRSSLRPHLVKQEQEADARLLAPAEEDEYYVEHLVDELLRADTAVRFEAYAKGITNGFLTINECRAMENRPPLPGGDVARSPLNTAPTAGPTPTPADDPAPPPPTSPTMETETRSLPSEIAGDGRTLTGLIPYNAPTRLTLGGRAMTEVIRPGAFARVVAEKRDVIATFNHDPNRMLGRTSSGTLTLTDTPEGLRFAVTLPESAADVRELVSRGDLKGASFTFKKTSRSAVAGETRELLDLDVVELGPVVFPAYGQSSVAMRSADGPPATPRARAVEGLMERAGI